MQLLQVLVVKEGAINDDLTEDEAIEKYGQRKFMRWVLITGCISLLCGIWVATGTQALSSASSGEAFFVLNLFTLLIAALAQLLLLVYASKLLPYLRQNVSMNYELLVVLVAYLISAAAYHVPTIILVGGTDKSEAVQWIMYVSIAPLARDAAVFVCSVIYPLRDQDGFVTYNETRECVKSLEMTLSAPVTYQHFARFVEAKHGRNGAAVVDLYQRLRICAHRLRKERPVGDLEEEIIRTCCSDSDVRTEVKALEKVSRESLKKDMEKNKMGTFDGIMDATMGRLRDYFQDFSQSGQFKDLMEVLRVQETISERLQQANLI